MAALRFEATPPPPQTTTIHACVHAYIHTSEQKTSRGRLPYAEQKNRGGGWGVGNDNLQNMWA